MASIIAIHGVPIANLASLYGVSISALSKFKGADIKQQAEATYLGGYSSGSGVAIYTYASAPIGTTDAQRTIVACCVANRNVAAAATLDSLELGGVAMTKQHEFNYGPSTRLVMSLFTVDASDGGALDTATADLVATYSNLMTNFVVGLWEVTNCSVTPYDYAGSSASPPSLTIDVPVCGSVVAFGSSDPTSFTGVTLDFEDLDSASMYCAGGHSDIPAGETARAISTTPVLAYPALIAASFGS